MVTLKIGLFGIGLDTYWGQFDEQKENWNHISVRGSILQLVIDANKDVKLEQNPGW